MFGRRRSKRGFCWRAGGREGVSGRARGKWGRSSTKRPSEPDQSFARREQRPPGPSSFDGPERSGDTAAPSVWTSQTSGWREFWFFLNAVFIFYFFSPVLSATRLELDATEGFSWSNSPERRPEQRVGGSALPGSSCVFQTSF